MDLHVLFVLGVRSDLRLFVNAPQLLMHYEMRSGSGLKEHSYQESSGNCRPSSLLLVCEQVLGLGFNHCETAKQVGNLPSPIRFNAIQFLLFMSHSKHLGLLLLGHDMFSVRGA